MSEFIAGGWILKPHPLGTTPLSVPIEIQGTSPAVDCLEDESSCDMFALALYVKYVATHMAMLMSPNNKYLKVIGGEISRGEDLLIDYVLDAAFRKYRSELGNVTAQSLADRMYRLFEHVLDSNRVNTIDINASAAKFSKLFEVSWRKVVQNGESVLAKFGPNLWLFCTRVRAYGSYPLAEVYGWTPVVEGDGKEAEIYKWYPVCIPLRVYLSTEEAASLGLLFDRSKRIMPMYPPASLPGVVGSLEWNESKHDDIDSVLQLMKKSLKFEFPYFWTFFSKLIPHIFTMLSVDCPYIPHWMLWVKKGELVVDKKPPGVRRSYLALAKLVAEKCQGVDYVTGRISPSAKAAVASQFTALFPHVLTRLINGPLINSFYWRLMYDISQGGGSLLTSHLEVFANAMGSLGEDKLKALSSSNVPIFNIINMYTLLSGPMLINRIKVIDNTEKREEHYMYAMVLPSPNWALVSTKVEKVDQLYDVRSSTFVPAFLPTVITFGVENVHLDTFPYTVESDGRLELLKPFESEAEFFKFAEYMYCARASSYNCEDPETLLTVGPNNSLAINTRLLEGDHPDAKRFFVTMERFWWIFIDSALEALSNTGLSNLADLYEVVLDMSAITGIYTPINLVRLAENDADPLVSVSVYTDEEIKRRIEVWAREKAK